MSKPKLIHGDCIQILKDIDPVTCIFADPPDNIGVKYKKYTDRIPHHEYLAFLSLFLRRSMAKSEVIWLSFNSRYIFEMGEIVITIIDTYKGIENWTYQLCIQCFTFGNYNNKALTNCYRPLLLLKKEGAPLYPDAIRISSKRQEIGDKRANPKGRVPSDVFDFPRVTGNSKQRRSWHPTQLNEGLVERCIKYCTKEGETVLDPFLGTGTTFRVCKKINRGVIGIEIDLAYCIRIGEEHGIEIIKKTINKKSY